MNREIERKFLVLNDSFIEESYDSAGIVQGYLARDDNKVIRVRITTWLSTGMSVAQITIKAKTKDDVGEGVDEFEYMIPEEDAMLLINTCSKPLVTKIRYLVEHEGRDWEIDVFGGHKAGTIIAEIELDSMNESISLPPWVGEEVTGKKEYFNSSM